GHVKVSGTFQFAGAVEQFGWSPDAQRLAYISNQISLGEHDLFLANLSGGGPLEISGPMTPGSNVFVFEWTGDAQKVVYISDQSVPGIGEVFLATPGHGTKRLSGNLVGGGNVIQLAVPEDGAVTF